MSTLTRKQLEGRIETLGAIIDKLITEQSNLKDLAIGTMTLLKKIPGYDEALAEMKNELKKEQEDEQQD